MYFKEIKELDLSWNQINDVGIFEKVKLELIEILNLYENKMNDISSLEKVKFEKLGKSKLNRIIYSNYDKILFYFN